MIEKHNDITYLEIKLEIFSVLKLIKSYPDNKSEIKKYLKNFKMDVYVLNLDPDMIYFNAIDHNDIDLAKSIKSYPKSVDTYFLLEHLRDYDNRVRRYIYDNVLIEYEPTGLLMEALHRVEFEKIFNIVSDNPDMNCEYLYYTGTC